MARVTSPAAVGAELQTKRAHFFDFFFTVISPVARMLPLTESRSVGSATPRPTLPVESMNISA